MRGFDRTTSGAPQIRHQVQKFFSGEGGNCHPPTHKSRRLEHWSASRAALMLPFRRHPCQAKQDVANSTTPPIGSPCPLSVERFLSEQVTTPCYAYCTLWNGRWFSRCKPGTRHQASFGESDKSVPGPRLFIGLDVHKETISVALAEGGERGEARVYGEIANRPDALRKLMSRLAHDSHELHFCYEAGPCGYGI